MEHFFADTMLNAGRKSKDYSSEVFAQVSMLASITLKLKNAETAKAVQLQNWKVAFVRIVREEAPPPEAYRVNE